MFFINITWVNSLPAIRQTSGSVIHVYINSNTQNLQIIWGRSSLEVRAVFVDMSKALDQVWHDALLYKLKLLSGYLKNNRHQRFVLNVQSLKWSLVEIGVSQESILGPFSFLFALMICHKDWILIKNSLPMTLHYSHLSPAL